MRASLGLVGCMWVQSGADFFGEDFGGICSSRKERWKAVWGTGRAERQGTHVNSPTDGPCPI